jgi:hypothetical protein
VVAGWPGAALASGHELGALGDTIIAVLLIGGGILFSVWAWSLWLLTRKRSIGVWFGGTIVAAALLPICFEVSKGENPKKTTLLFVVALFPSALHQLKMFAPYLRPRAKE